FEFSTAMGIPFRIACRALSRNPLRAVLAVIGITIGTSAVISTVAIGEGGAAQIHEQLLMLGDNLVWIEAGGRNVNGLRTGPHTTPTLLLSDMNTLVRDVSGLKSCSPQSDGSIQVIYGNQTWRTGFRGVHAAYL